MTETDRLILRRWRSDDAEALYKYASDERVSRLAMWPRHDSVAMSREVIDKFFTPYPDIFAMVLKGTDEPIGCIGLVPQGEEHYHAMPSEREVGYWIGHPYWGKGLTTEALALLIDHCRRTPGMASLLITTDSRNAASIRVAEKCGFRFVRNYDYDGISCNAYRLQLTAGEEGGQNQHRELTADNDAMLT